MVPRLMRDSATGDFGDCRGVESASKLNLVAMELLEKWRLYRGLMRSLCGVLWMFSFSAALKSMSRLAAIESSRSRTSGDGAEHDGKFRRGCERDCSPRTARAF